MKNYIEGTLSYDYTEERYQIKHGIEKYTKGLHCGQSLEVYLEHTKEWYKTRLEMSVEQEWYLIGLSRQFSLQGALVRMSIE